MSCGVARAARSSPLGPESFSAAGTAVAINPATKAPIARTLETTSCAFRFIKVPSIEHPNLQYLLPARPSVAGFHYSKLGVQLTVCVLCFANQHTGKS